MAHKTWRDDAGMNSELRYKKHFAYRPIITEEGVKVWWKNYYSVHRHWWAAYENGMHHVEKAGYITEAEYLVRKLTEGI